MYFFFFGVNYSCYNLLFYVLFVKSNWNKWIIIIRVSLSAKLWVDALGIKKKKSLKKILSKIGPKTEPWGTQDVIVSKSLSLLFIWTQCLRSFK